MRSVLRLSQHGLARSQHSLFWGQYRTQLQSQMSLGMARLQSSKSSGGVGSLFEEETGVVKPTDIAENDDASSYLSNKDMLKVPFVKDRVDPTGETAPESLLSPLKRALYTKVVANNHGTYVNNQVIEHEGRKYRLSLSRDEQKALEPTVYVQSYRIKSSWKKMFMFLRIFRRMPLMEAITQCHFSAKGPSKDVAEMLERARKDAVKLGFEPENLVVDQIWVGKDGGDIKRLQSKGRGRSGIITHPYVHVKAILKDRRVFDQREQWMKQRLDRKLWNQLRNWKIKEDYVQTANYKW